MTENCQREYAPGSRICDINRILILLGNGGVRIRGLKVINVVVEKFLRQAVRLQL
jgi:hypothetical protein